MCVRMCAHICVGASLFVWRVCLCVRVWFRVTVRVSVCARVCMWVRKWVWVSVGA